MDTVIRGFLTKHCLEEGDTSYPPADIRLFCLASRLFTESPQKGNSTCYYSRCMMGRYVTVIAKQTQVGMPVPPDKPASALGDWADTTPIF